MGYLVHSLSDNQRNANLTSNSMTWTIRVTWSSSMSGVMGLRSSDSWSPTLTLALPLFWSTVALNPRQEIQLSVFIVLPFIITIQNSPGTHTASGSVGTAPLSWQRSGSGGTLTTHHRLAPILRMSTAIPLLLHCAHCVMSWGDFFLEIITLSVYLIAKSLDCLDYFPR